MKNKNKNMPKTAIGRLMMVIEGMEVFLHPRVLEALKKAVWEARTEMAQEAKNQIISRELQELEPLLNYYRKSLTIYSENNGQIRHLWNLRPVLRKIIELYGKSQENETRRPVQ